MHGFLQVPHLLDYRMICETVYRFDTEKPEYKDWMIRHPWYRYNHMRLAWLARKKSYIPKKRKCHTLQAEADKISDI
jgi:hypothetical protein